MNHYLWTGDKSLCVHVNQLISVTHSKITKFVNQTKKWITLPLSSVNNHPGKTNFLLVIYSSLVEGDNFDGDVVLKHPDFVLCLYTQLIASEIQHWWTGYHLW